MMPRTPAAAEFTPVFDWGPPRRRRISLISFLAGSIVLHALCFYLFQVVYPLTTSLSPPPARVTLLSPRSEEARALLQWVAAEDPALAATTVRPPESATALPPAPAHIPSFHGYAPALKELPPYRPDLRIPSAYPPGPVPLARPAAAPSPAATVPTRLEFALVEPALGPAQIPPLRFTLAGNAPPAPASFRVAIDRAGSVRHCLLEQSSGDRALDEQARRALLLARFSQPPAQTDSMRWTLATFHWGNDLASPAPKASAP